MQEKLLTFVVPAYNVEKYIAQCLESLLNQSVQNHNIIIVNDGSTDGTEKICLEYEKNFPDVIKYVYQENKGLGGARNTGISLVKTPYLTCLDSDDAQNHFFVEKLTKKLEETPFATDIIFQLPVCFDSVSKLTYSWFDKDRFYNLFSKGTAINVVTTPEIYSTEMSFCRKIFRTDFLRQNNFKFQEKVKWEDVRPHYELLHKAQSVIGLDCGFFYRTNNSSQTTSGSGATRLDLIPVFEDLFRCEQKENFSKTERAYALETVFGFSQWAIDVTNTDYIKPLLKGLHQIFKKIAKPDYLYFIKFISKNKIGHKRLWKILRTSLYKKYSNLSTRRKLDLYYQFIYKAENKIYAKLKNSKFYKILRKGKRFARM